MTLLRVIVHREDDVWGVATIDFENRDCHLFDLSPERLPLRNKFSMSTPVFSTNGHCNTMATTNYELRTTNCRRVATTSAFTLLEVLIALALVAVLLSIAVPYMKDAFSEQQSDQISESIATLVQQTRATAMKIHESRYIDFNDPSFRQLFPAGWQFQLERMGDQKFHAPASGERWEFNGEGICDPLSLKIQGPGQIITLKFDPITGEVLHDE